MKKANKAKLNMAGGAMMAAALGMMAGMMLAPKSGKELRKDAKKKAADFYKQLGPQLKKMKTMSEKEYKAAVKKAMASYAKAKKLTKKEAAMITKEAEGYWREFKKHL